MGSIGVCTCTRIVHDHGQYQMYHRHGCRCLKCAVEAGAAKGRYRAGGSYSTPGEGFVDRTGTVRRLRALLRLGWRHSDISPRLTAILGRPALSEMILRHPGDMCFAATAKAVRAVYEELSMKPGPSKRNRDRATTLGYLPPLAWEDETIDDPHAVPYRAGHRPRVDDTVDAIAIERRLAGDDVKLTRHEMQAAVHLLHEQGLTVTQITKRLHISGSWANELIARTDTAA